MKLAASVSLAALALAACATTAAAPLPATAQTAAPSATPPAGPATAQQAREFIARAEKELADLNVISQRAQWVNSTYITEDTDALAAYFGTLDTELRVRLANEAARYAGVQGLDYDTSRKLNLLRSALTLPAPTTPGAAAELNTISTRLQSTYGKGRGTLNGKPMTGNDLEEKMGTVRDPTDLKEMWTSWHTNVGRPMRPDYARLVEIANQGAKELGFSDTGAMWRSRYDMSPEEFAAMTDRLWNEVKPLYDQLHCYTRSKLNQKYGAAIQPANGPIRSDLLGNMWAQEWGNIYDVVAPRGAGEVGYDLTELLVRNKYTPEKIVRTGEAFFSSLGFAPLPQTFWSRSMITAPRDREVICHASAWDVDNVEDL
ncbi:MAG TPA: M2 family metallopeptidase, partial [Sphingomicrobium sp.]|nr:M2 family metallopeptidase [Sphingomicrobium sp.]